MPTRFKCEFEAKRHVLAFCPYTCTRDWKSYAAPPARKVYPSPETDFIDKGMMREVWDSKLEVAAMFLGWVFGVCIENIGFSISMSVSVCSFTFLVLDFQYSPKLKSGQFSEISHFLNQFWFLCRPHIPGLLNGTYL